jgi:hypothetical protein
MKYILQYKIFESKNMDIMEFEAEMKEDNIEFSNNEIDRIGSIIRRKANITMTGEMLDIVNTNISLTYVGFKISKKKDCYMAIEYFNEKQIQMWPQVKTYLHIFKTFKDLLNCIESSISKIKMIDIDKELIDDLCINITDNNYEIGHETSYIVSYPNDKCNGIYKSGFVTIDDHRYHANAVISNIIHFYGERNDNLFITEARQIERRLPDNIELYGVTRFQTYDNYKYSIAFINK